MTVKDFYDKIAPFYDGTRYGNIYQKTVADLECQYVTAFLCGGTCLEIGAGTGRLTSALVKYQERVLATDVSRPMLELLESRVRGSNLETTKCDVYSISALEKYGVFHNVVTLRVLPHLNDPIRAIEKMRGAVVPEGRIIFDLWNAWGYQAVANKLGIRSATVETYYMTIAKMRKVIRDAGLMILDSRGFGYPPWKAFLSLERRPISPARVFAQRIIWVCSPTR